ncbi:MAG: cytochrome P450, partial [Deltaproteobacteria bacterium]|nr:cytochrome P450 [Deltaproteobacteria bacterium]
MSFLDGRFFAHDMHEACTWMRANEPVFRDSNGLLGVTRHADIMAVSKDATTFCSGRGFRPDAPIMPMMINMDRPEHMVRRGLVNAGFTPRRVAEMEPRIREICRGLVDRVQPRGECEFVREVAARLPLIVIADLLGVREEDHDQLLEWSDATMSAGGNPDPRAGARAAAAFTEYQDYCMAVVAE